MTSVQCRREDGWMDGRNDGEGERSGSRRRKGCIASKKTSARTAAIGSSLRPGRLGISTRMVILIRTHTKKYI